MTYQRRPQRASLPIFTFCRRNHCKWLKSYAETITHKVFLVDLLDWTDFIAFDAGPGQIMLREKDFYDAHESGYSPPERPIAAKVESLFTRFEEGVKSLFATREQRLDRQKKLFEGFRNEPFAVNQSEMTFVP